MKSFYALCSRKGQFLSLLILLLLTLAPTTFYANNLLNDESQCPPEFQNVPPNVTVQCDEVPAVANVSATSCCAILSITFTETRDVGIICGDDYKLTRIWTATDECGNTSTASQIIQVIDTEPPFFINPPGDISGECIDIPAAEELNVGDNCDKDVFQLMIETKNPGPCFGTFNLTRLYVIRDNCDNANTHVQVITIKDLSPPTFTQVPSDATIDCNGPIPPAIVGQNLIAVDDCSPNVLISQSEEIIPGSCPIFYTIKRIFTANDGCGNIATASQSIVVTDNQAPQIQNVPPNVTVECNAPQPSNPIAVDNCDPMPKLTVLDIILSGGGCGEDVLLQRVWTATDECGNSSTASQLVTVKIMGEILISDVPDDVTVNCDDVPDPVMVSANDACGLPLAVSYSSQQITGNCAGNYIEIRTWTVTDPCGNMETAQQVVTVVDDEAPIFINAPSDITVQCSDVPDPMMVSVLDNCDADPLLSMVETVNGLSCAMQVITRTWSATDHCGNSSQFTQKITVLDDQPPYIVNPPADITVECGLNLPPVPPLIVEDDCGSGNVEIKFQELSNGNVCSGQQIGRIWTLTDECGNMSTFIQTITVFDDLPPVVNAPDDITIDCSEIPTLEEAIINDECDDNPAVKYTEMVTQGTCPVIYTLMRTWVAEDKCGNTSSGIQNVTVLDTEGPVIMFIHPLLAGLMDGDTLKIACDKPVIFDLEDVKVTDNCDPNPKVWMEETLIEYGPCVIFMLCTFVAEDECGNQSTLSFYYLIGDDEPPVLVGVPDDLTLECDQPIPSPAVVTAIDNCTKDVEVIYTETILPGNCEDNYMIVRTWTAEDECGNTVSASQKITIQDTTPPIWMPMHPIFNGLVSGDTIFFECDGIVILDEDDLIAKDNCDEDLTLTFEEEILQGNCKDDGYFLKMICTWTAVDNCGNDTTFVLIVLVTDTTPPVLSGQKKNITINCDEPIPAFPPITAEDNCDGPLPVFSESTIIPGNCPQEYTIQTICWAEDACGNRAETTQNIFVVDNTPPTFTSTPEDITIECGTPIPGNTVTATDNCDPNPQITYEEKQANGPCLGNYLIIRTWIATDACGNLTSINQLITVNDTEAPTLLGVPVDVTVECDNVPNPAVVKAVDACDPDVVVVYTQVRIDGPCDHSYTLIRTWIATDDCGNSVSAQQEITVQDTEAPVLGVVPASITIECDEVIPAPGVVTAEDNCDPNPKVTLEVDIIQGNCPQEYTIVRTWTATDDCGNTSSKSQTITVVDTEAPVFTFVPAYLELECDEVIPAFQPEIVDNCDNNPTVSLQETKIPGSCLHEFILVRVWTATDACGNSSTAEQTIKVTDNTPPVIMTLHPGLNGVMSGDTLIFECDNVTLFDIDDVKATDNCDDNPDLQFTEVEKKGDCIQDGYILEMLCTWTATDDCGNTSSFYIVVQITDSTPPVIKGVPANVTIECDQDLPSTSGVFAEDNCTENPTLTLSENIVIGNCKDSYILTRTWTATDDCGNTATASQVITVQDTTAPELIGVPEDLTIECDQDLPDPADVTAIDNCDDAPVVTFKEAREDGDCPQEYTLLRIWQATDACGNSAVATQIIKIVDTKAPILLGVPADVTVECDNVPNPAAVKAVDACDPDVDVVYTQVRIDGPCDHSYTLIRTWLATDDCGNSVSAQQEITIQDTEPPVLGTVPASITIECDEVIPAPGVVTVEDNCDPNPKVTLEVEIIQGNCPQEYTILRTWTATDDCGNSSTKSQTITVVDTEAPVFTFVPGYLELECDEVIPSSEPEVVDNCDNNPTVSLQETKIPGSCLHEYILVRVWTATDACGNSSTAEQTIKVTDNTPPVIMTLHPGLNGVMSGDTLIFECDNVTIFDIDDVKATDNCDDNPDLQFTEVEKKGDCIQDGFILEMLCTWTATDDCGNTSSFFIVVQITDSTPPVIKGVPANVTIECDQDLPSTSGVFAEDNCTENPTLTLSENIVIGNCKDSYILTRTWTATDDCGNTATASQVITVQDTTAPELIGVPEDLTLECDQDLPDPADVTAIDNCDDAPIVTFKEAREDGDCPQEYTLLRIWQATDACGNSAVATQIIKVVDTKAPILLGVPADVTVECDNVPNPAAVKAVDACDPDVDVVYTQVRIDGPCEQSYTLIRTWTATDDCGNSVSAQQEITVQDTEAPVFTKLPGDLTIACDLPLPDLEYEVEDNCSDNISITITIEGGKPCDGIADRRIIKATDECGNTTIAIQEILLIDTVPPVFKPYDNKIEVPCDEITNWPAPEVMDNCDDDVEVTLKETKVPGACINEYTLIREWTATDDCGNQATAIQLIIIVDEEAPVLIPTHPLLVGVPSGSTLTVNCDEVPDLEDTFIAEDNCDPNPEITFEEVLTSGDCLLDGYFIKMICTWTATDACGNSSSYTVTILITDNKAPVFTKVPDDVTIDCTDTLPTETAEAEDNCTDVNIDFDDQEIDEDCGYTIIRTWTAEDECGNIATAVQTIRVLDSSAPVFTTTVEDITVDLDEGENVPDPITVTAFDSCGTVTVVFNETESPGFDCGYILTRTWTAEDECGNTAQLTQIVTVLKACPCVLPEIESVDLVNPDCGLKNGIITINTVEDPGLYDYQWLPNKGLANQIGNSRTNLTRGTYFVVVSDPTAKDCFVKLNITLDPIGTCIDTLYASTGLEEAITVCTDPVLDFNGAVASAEICGFDPNEVTVSVNQNSGCVLITPLEGFTGTTEVCVIHCNDETPEVCDTTYIFLTVSAVKPCDDIFTEAFYNLEAPTCESEATLCLNIDPLVVQDYQILIDGVVYNGPFDGCGNNGIGIQLPVGNFEVEISHLPSQCTESRIIGVSCPDKTEFMAIDDFAKTRINRSVAIPVLYNDIVPANMFVKSFDIMSGPLDGTIYVNEDLTVIYKPNENFCGLDSFTYQICIDEGICDEAVAVIDVSCRKLIIYNGFSPNGDNVNDRFTIEGIADYPKNELRVFNRWGNQVYFQKGYKNSWDGTWEGGNLPDGTYFYMFDDGEGENYNGYLQILR